MIDEKYVNNKNIELLAEKYPNEPAVYSRIINLNAILNLPKGTEHFMSDIHGEYEAFLHIINNCSGVISEKVDIIFGDKLSDEQRRELCTLIYYPKEKMHSYRKNKEIKREVCVNILNYLIEVARLLASKYTRSKVREALPQEFSFIIDELLHMQKDEDDNQILYHKEIIDAIIDVESTEDFIVALTDLIKRLAVDHLHIVGDIFDRGPSADKILDMLMNYHSLDIQWGNHDILWMGACAGSQACCATVIKNNIKAGNIYILENSYGISLRELTLFAEKTYKGDNVMEKAHKAISVILFKLEGQIIKRNPEYKMEDRLLLHLIDREKGTIKIEDKVYELNNEDFPTLVKGKEYELTKEEERVVESFTFAFKNSFMLNKHIRFLYSVGSMYLIYNNNLLYHGCIPLDSKGDFEKITLDNKEYWGKAYLDYADKIARAAYFGKENISRLDFMWYLWCGRKSPLSGRNVKTFERAFISDKSAWTEETNPYYKYYYEKDVCIKILKDFGLELPFSHIINGHTPVKTNKGEKPVRANGKLIVIDGGFCSKYHKVTGIAGYTLIYNSHGMRIKAHQPFESIERVLSENKDIKSSSDTFETEYIRVRVKDTDIGIKIMEEIIDLYNLLMYYRNRNKIEDF